MHSPRINKCINRKWKIYLIIGFLFLISSMFFIIGHFYNNNVFSPIAFSIALLELLFLFLIKKRWLIIIDFIFAIVAYTLLHIKIIDYIINSASIPKIIYNPRGNGVLNIATSMMIILGVFFYTKMTICLIISLWIYKETFWKSFIRNLRITLISSGFISLIIFSYVVWIPFSLDVYSMFTNLVIISLIYIYNLNLP